MVQKPNTTTSIGPKRSTERAVQPKVSVLRDTGITARILLIDDDDIVTHTLSMMLRTDGHVVTTASSGQEAFQLFCDNPYDLIITDLFMPQMSGWEIIRRIRDISKDIPVVVLTGSIEAMTSNPSHSFEELGVADILMKPIRMADLLSRVQSVVRRSKGNRITT